MKEATGELTTTVITVAAIGALVAFFYLVIWPNLQTSMALSSACNAAGGNTYAVENDDGSRINCADGTCTYEKDGKVSTKNCD